MSKKILVVEDEPAIADNITYALMTEGFEPTWCSTINDGMKIVNEEPPALIVLDVGLPDGSGFEMCKEIRKSSNVPIIFLTARADEIDRVVGLEIGGDDYMVKPFSPRELTARVKAVLRRFVPPEQKPRPKASRLPFTVDEERWCITYKDCELSLSRYEFMILKILINRPGRIYPRDQLMEMVWDDPYSSLLRTVDAHIKSLRAKLKAVDPDIDAIKTFRGVGYALKENW